MILYAIIRKDGSVDSIQLVHSVDPHLDANAMEALAQWKFRPGEKHGEPDGPRSRGAHSISFARRRRFEAE